MSREAIKENLIKMGYKLKDCGNHWRTNALYRGGTNPTSLLIYKDTGVWTDFVKNTPSLPFKRLVFATLQTNDEKDIENFLSGVSDSSSVKHTPKMSTEKIYSEDMLERLLPHYLFYNQKGIPNKCLSDLRSGLATEGAMYQRYVFPIYNEFGQIHGFSGRDMLDKEDRPKWKLIGKKSNWVYPSFVKVDGELFYKNEIEKHNSVILVESIGDLLALHSCGIYNCVVLFGTSISSKLLCFLISFELKSIHISLNNDSNKERNSGRIGSIKTIIKLLNYFSIDKIHLSPPSSNDFGDMDNTSISDWKNNLTNNKIDPESLLEEARDLTESNELVKSSFNSLKKHLS